MSAPTLASKFKSDICHQHIICIPHVTVRLVSLSQRQLLRCCHYYECIDATAAPHRAAPYL